MIKNVVTGLGQENVVTLPKRLAANRYGLAEQRRNIWQVMLEDGRPYEAVFDKDFWGHMAVNLRPFDRIEVLADDGSYFAELLVLSVSKTQAAVMELRKIDISTKEPAPVAEEFSVKWRGPHAKWSVIRTDGSVVKDGFDSADAARAFALTAVPRPVS